MPNKKICPIMSRVVVADNNPNFNDGIVVCEKENCQLYISGYTTEKLPISCCAFEFLALKNSEGLYRV